MITTRAGIPGTGGQREGAYIIGVDSARGPDLAVISCNNCTGFTTSRSVPLIHDDYCRHLAGPAPWPGSEKL